VENKGVGPLGKRLNGMPISLNDTTGSNRRPKEAAHRCLLGQINKQVPKFDF